MAAQAELGLKFNLSAWSRGIKQAAGTVKKALGPSVLTPFERGAKKAARTLKMVFAGAGRAIGAALKSAFAPLIAIFAVGAIFATIKKTLTGSLQAFRDYSDSVTTLTAALETLNGVSVEEIKQRVADLGNELRLALGITSAETNRAFSTFVTRGFDERQARQLTILAANYAKKSGKPIADVTKQIADAANGSVDAMKELGVEITTTGNRVNDGVSAVLALKAAYGDIGADLANPSERLAAAWNQLAITLGENISPILEPIIQGLSDFVTGLAQTEEGRKFVQDIADAFGSAVDFIGEAILRTTGFVEAVISGSKVVYHTLREVLLKLAADMNELIMKHPVLKFLAGKLGFDPGPMREAYREMAKESAKASAEAIGGWQQGRDAMSGQRSGTGILGRMDSIRQQGAAAREAATASLQREMAATQNEGFAGDPAKQAEALKMAQKQAAAQKQLAGRARAYGEVPDRDFKMSVTMVGRRNNPFSKRALR